MTGGCWWSRDIAAAQQQHFFSFQLVLPNGRAEEKKFVEGSAAVSVIWKSLIFNEAGVKKEQAAIKK